LCRLAATFAAAGAEYDGGKLRLERSVRSDNSFPDVLD
jgi:hypothetical protein